MIARSYLFCFLIAILLLPVASVFAEESAASTAPAASSDGKAADAANKTFSQQDLDQLLAPIALYPDALLAQVLMASTYPLEIVQAARWVEENPKLKGEKLEDALQKQTWDPAVKSITAVPTVLGQMNDNLEWTQKLGDAFLAQQKEVMATTQSLRAKAKEAGNLDSSEKQVVKEEKEGETTIYIIESSEPEVIYVPTYNPTVVYGVWWYPYPPYHMYPPHYAYPPYVSFSVGVFVGAAVWGNCNWHGNNVYINVNHYNSFNRTNINNGNWNHNVDHRKGVAYQDRNVAKQYNRDTTSRNSAAQRDASRGYNQAGAGGAQTRDAGTAQPRAAQSGGKGSGQTGGFSGVDRGNTRMDSQRGSSSRASAGRGGGGARGGGRR